MAHDSAFSPEDRLSVLDDLDALSLESTTEGGDEILAEAESQESTLTTFDTDDGTLAAAVAAQAVAADGGLADWSELTGEAPVRITLLPVASPGEDLRIEAGFAPGGEDFGAGGCACAMCCGSLDGAGASGSGGTAEAPSTTGSINTLSTYLQSGYSSAEKFNLGTSGIGDNSGILHYNYYGFDGSRNGYKDSDGIELARRLLVDDAFDYLGEILGIDFRRTTSDEDHVDFFFIDNVYTDKGNERAFASNNTHFWSSSTIDYSVINITPGWHGGRSDLGGSNGYTYQTILHEILHGMGLGHQGQYNAKEGVTITYENDAIYTNDSWALSIMSYFNQVKNTGNETVGYDKAHLVSLSAVDFDALNDMYASQGYGVSNAFNGNTIYGVGTNISSATSAAMAGLAGFADTNAFTIVDGSGIDTVDFSNYAADQTIRLGVVSSSSTVGSVSSVGGLTGNMNLAVGTVIENATTGAGNDSIYGNQYNNTLIGNAGNDRLYAYSGNDVIEGGAGRDLMYAHSGNDTFIYRNGLDAENDLVNAGTGTDRILLAGAGLYDFRTMNVDSIEEIEFLAQSNVSRRVQLSNKELDGADEFSSTLRIDGSNTTASPDRVDVYLDFNGANGYSANISGWIFQDWTSADSVYVYGGSASNTVYATDMADYISLSDGDDSATGEDGNDSMYGGYGNDELWGERDDDLLYGSYGNDELVAGDGNDSAYGGTGDDGVYGGAGSDYLEGGSGNDILGGVGTNTAYGGSGNDQFYAGLNSTNRFYGDTGEDQLYGGSAFWNRFYIGDDKGQLFGGTAQYNYVYGGAGLNYTYGGSGVERHYGGSGFDYLTGRAGNDSFFGGSGNDRAYGGDGNDWLSGGNDNDSLYGGEGRDSIYGESGNDLLYSGAANFDEIYGGTGSDTYYGGAGNFTHFYAGGGDNASDTATGGSANDRFYSDIDSVGASALTGALYSYGGDGNDIHYGAGGYDEAHGGVGNDAAYGRAGDDALYGGDGNDWLDGGAGIDTMVGGTGNDTFVIDRLDDVVTELLGGGVDRIRADLSFDLSTVDNIEDLQLIGTLNWQGRGNELDNVITGNSGNNLLAGRDGDDALYAGAGNDRVYGQAGNDLMYGGTGNDIMVGDTGINTYYGNDGNDVMYGGADGESFYGGAGIDRMFGRGGDDFFNGGSETDLIYGGAGNDRLDGGTDDDRLYGGAGVNQLNGEDGNDLLYGGSDVDSIFGGNGYDRLYGDAGNDRLNGGAGTSRMEGGDGDDVILGGSEYDLAYGGDGNDIFYGYGGDDRLIGQAGVDLMYGGTGANIMQGGAGNDAIYGGSGNERLYGGADDDVLSAYGGNDIFFGEAGRDLMYGGSGNDLFYGGTGNDLIDGGTGNDQMAGGADADTFIFANGFGIDTIIDFDTAASGEVINLANVTNITSWTDLQASHLITNLSGHLVIVDGVGINQITLSGVTSVSADDFVFV